MTDDLETHRAVLVRQELAETLAKIEAEGMDPKAIIDGLTSLLNDYIANATNQATAAAYLFGAAKHAAILAAQDLPPELKN